MTSLASVPEGLPMVSAVALTAVPVLALAAARNPMIVAPGQVSATSHSFAVTRHTVPALPAGCWHELLVPLHWSTVQGLLSVVQAVPDGFLASDGHEVLVPVQNSTASHSPAAARQGAPALPAGCVHVALVPLHTSVVQ